MKKHGHYCKVCGEYKANEKFSGKGHASHICKSCASLPAEKQAEAVCGEMDSHKHCLPQYAAHKIKN